MKVIQNVFQAKPGQAMICGNAIRKMAAETNAAAGPTWSAAQGLLGQPLGWFALSTHVESLQEFVDHQASSSEDRSQFLSAIGLAEHLMVPPQLHAYDLIYAPEARPPDWAIGAAVSTAIDATRMPEVLNWANAGADLALKITGISSHVVLNPRADGAPRLAFPTLLPSLAAYETRQAKLDASEEFRAHLATGQEFVIPMTGQSGLVQRLI